MRLSLRQSIGSLALLAIVPFAGACGDLDDVSFLVSVGDLDDDPHDRFDGGGLVIVVVDDDDDDDDDRRSGPDLVNRRGLRAESPVGGSPALSLRMPGGTDAALDVALLDSRGARLAGGTVTVPAGTGASTVVHARVGRDARAGCAPCSQHRAFALPRELGRSPADSLFVAWGAAPDPDPGVS